MSEKQVTERDIRLPQFRDSNLEDLEFDGSWYEYWNIPNAPMWQKVYSREDFSFNRVPLKALRAAIADHERTDYVSDIRNHIAPTTVVIER